jgi:hypothetical protein
VIPKAIWGTKDIGLLPDLLIKKFSDTFFFALLFNSEHFVPGVVEKITTPSMWFSGKNKLN